MHGNAWEWCSDFYQANYYRVSPVDDPRGPSSGAERVIRGGAWDKFGAHCGSAFRTGKPRNDKGYNTGFRVARNPE
jgi:formylglycine-generating enzyme required for sulfatase activity